MASSGALEGLRVLDLTNESGRFAGKLLAEAGAEVVRLYGGASGAPMRGAAGERGGVLDWWFDGGTRRELLDLETPAGRERFQMLARHADLLIETEPPGRLAGIGLDYPDLQPLNPALVHVSLTPFGREGPRADWRVSDLVANALGGVLSVTGDPEQPINPWGRQAFNVGGFYAAIAGLVGVHLARQTGAGQHIDLSLHEAVISCTEQVLMGWFYQDRLPGVQREPVGIYRRQRSLHWTGAYEVMACRDGAVMVTLVPNTSALIRWLAEEGVGGVVAEIAAGTVDPIGHIPDLMQALRAFAATREAHQFFLEGQRRHLAWGEVLTVAAVAQNPQLQVRGFFRPVQWEGPEVLMPGPAFRTLSTPAPPAAAPILRPLADAGRRDVDVGEKQQTPLWLISDSRPLAKGVGNSSRHPTPDTRHPPLAGVRVLDFTWVLAGPFATRILADLGADVIKLQTEERATGTNSSEHPYQSMWNRSKRSVALNMKHPRAPETFRRLVEQADIVFENFSAGVLERWGIGYEAARAWNERIIYIGMSGPGREGPWRDFVTYAPTIHALSGLTHLTGQPGQDDIGHGLSYNDHASGLAGALAALEALEARRRTGQGQFVDLSQYEVGVYTLGPGYVDFQNNGREAQPAGNRDPFEDVVPNEVYRCRGDEWLAISARDDEEWRRLCTAIGDSRLTDDPRLAAVEGRRELRALVDERIAAWALAQDAEEAMRLLQAAGVPAGMVQTARDLATRDEQLAARGWLAAVEHPLLGRRPVDRFPARFEATPLGPSTAAPVFGQQTFEVYHELLGLSDEQIAEAIGEGLFA
jgi:crotonobetainyl-CoA:carnitine CoA-transferase CaiB-like acyl-CoA transferase